MHEFLNLYGERYTYRIQNTSYGYTAHDKVQDSTCVVGSEKDYRL